MTDHEPPAELVTPELPKILIVDDHAPNRLALRRLLAKAGAELVEADPTSGMLRRRAFEVPGLWAGQVVTGDGKSD